MTLPPPRGPRRSIDNRPLPRTREELSRDPMVRAMLAADAAEHRGDVAAALAVVTEMAAADRRTDGTGPMWRRGRVERLQQLDLLGSTLPRWAGSRWLVAQAAQWLHPRARRRGLKALRVALDVRGGPDPERDLFEERLHVTEADWVHRQVLLYELGGLTAFLRHAPARDLVAGADRIQDWASAPLRAWQLQDVRPETLTWCDVGTDERVETLNLGGATFVEDHACALGRLVPIEGGAMFETAPLPVPDQTAARVAADPTAWIEAVRDGIAQVRREGAPARLQTSGLHDFGLLTDVPRWVWRSPQAAFTGTDGGLCVDELPVLAARLLAPEVARRLLERRAPEEEIAVMRAAAVHLPEPAGSLVRHVCGLTTEAA